MKIYRAAIRWSAAVLILGSTLLLTATLIDFLSRFYIRSNLPSQAERREGCLQSFNEFAYLGPYRTLPKLTPPSSPWQVEASLAAFPDEAYQGYGGFRAQFSRAINGRQEIWITAQRRYQRNADSMSMIILYYPDSREWEFVSTEIGETGLSADQFELSLYLTSDNSVWLKTEMYRTTNLPIESLPVLTKFNEITRHFDALQGVPEIHVNDSEARFYWPTIILDETDHFVVFITDDGVYRYDPVSGRTERRQEWPEDGSIVLDTTAENGSVYFKKILIEELDFRLRANTIFQFSTQSGQMTAIDVPDEGWPTFGGMLVDDVGRLWLGATGYREVDGQWHLIHANLTATLDHAGQIIWAPARLMMQSSDGRLWFSKYVETGGDAEGTAWYDPESREGCLMTNYAASVIEDSARRLWMIAGSILYSMSL